jgi:hypothetical protein
LCVAFILTGKLATILTRIALFLTRKCAIDQSQPKLSGSYVSRLNGWFKASCFVQPPTPFSFGNESRVDSQLRGEGVDNWDLAISKQTNISEQVKLNFEIEFLNAFNRVQFSPPSLTLGGTPALGVASGTQLNNPREIQFSARLIF